MKQYNVEELKTLNQLLLAIFITADFSYYLNLHHNFEPWYTLGSVAIGLVLIVSSWSGTRYILFNITLILCAALLTLAYNWSSIFNLH